MGSLEAQNLGLVGKWKWRFLNEENALWHLVIKDFYRVDGGSNSPASTHGLGGGWCDILKAVKSIESIDDSFNHSFTRPLSDGSNTLFWKDVWGENGVRHMDKFPRLFALETNKDCIVCDRWRLENNVWGGKWAWRSPPRGRLCDDLASLLSLIGSLTLSANNDDKWLWTHDASGIFKVKTLSRRLQDLTRIDHSLGSHHVWNSWIPRKVNICVWRASINRLATRTNLSLRGVSFNSTTCPFCEEFDEDIDHCLIRCPRVLSVWRKDWNWWNLDPPVLFPSFGISDIALVLSMVVVMRGFPRCFMQLFKSPFGLFVNGEIESLLPFRIPYLKLGTKTFSHPFRGLERRGYLPVCLLESLGH